MTTVAFLHTCLNYTISTDRVGALCRTGISVDGIAVITLFVGAHHPIAAFQLAVVITAIIIGKITVVAGFIGIDIAVAALHNLNADGRLVSATE